MSDQESDTQANEGQELQQENISSTENEGENEGHKLQQENISSTENEGENVDSVGQQESTNSGSQNMLERFNNAVASENDRHSQNLTTVLTTIFTELVNTIQNLNVSTSETPKTDELNQNYSQNMSKVVTPETEKLNQNCSQNKAGKAFYDTKGKRGLLFILQFGDSKDWKEGNANDLKVLNEFFKVELEFDVWSCNTFSEFDEKLRKMSLDANHYYCLMICISGHGNEDSVLAKFKKIEEEKETIEPKFVKIADIKARFSNVSIQSLSGVPKIIIIDTCRGDKFNWTVDSAIELKAMPPTTDSDLLLINATTPGHVSAIPKTGSVGIQGVMKALNANWKNDHLEEMLIDARNEVAQFGAIHQTKELRQTLETQSTLTKRLMFVKSEK